MKGLEGYCGKCERRFSLTELKTGKCPYQDCNSDDIYARGEYEDKRGKYIGGKFNSDEDRAVHHNR